MRENFRTSVFSREIFRISLVVELGLKGVSNNKRAGENNILIFLLFVTMRRLHETTF
jgi:hypothetical protein